MSDFLALVKAERQKQINKHGYTPEHDDDHTDGSIADAGACYGANSSNIWQEIKFYHKLFNYAKGGFDLKGRAMPLWKWHGDYFKKEDHNRKEQLVIGAAFYMAEYERIVRAEQKQNGETNEIH